MRGHVLDAPRPGDRGPAPVLRREAAQQGDQLRMKTGKEIGDEDGLDGFHPEIVTELEAKRRTWNIAPSFPTSRRMAENKRQWTRQVAQRTLLMPHRTCPMRHLTDHLPRHTRPSRHVPHR